MTAGAGGWVAATASVRGASHERSGKPNQDAVRVVQVDGPPAGLVAAVCDGHGGDRYVRSDVGSRIGVEVACSVGRGALEALGPHPSLAVIEAHLTGAVAEAIVDRWRTRVLAEVERHPFTNEERTRAGSPLDADPLVSYGCTLVLAIMAQSWVGLLQIGDGDVTVVREAHAESPVPGDDRLIGGETTSLCLPTAVADARVSVLGEPLPEMLILTSDGYANSFASPTWRTDAGLDLRRHVRQIGMDGVESRLPSWLTDSAIAAGDDVSMALIHRSALARPTSSGLATAESVGGVGATRQSETPASTQTTRRKRGLAIAGLAIVVGAAAGWLLAQATQSEATPEAIPEATPAPTTALQPSSTIATESTDPPASATASTVPPPPPSTSPVLAEQDDVFLFTGESVGVILAFDPNNLDTEPRSFGWVTTQSRPLAAAGWELNDGNLTLNGKSKAQAIAAYAPYSEYVWAVSDDCRTLTAYKAIDGTVMIERTITEVGVDGAPASCPRTTTAEPAESSQGSVGAITQNSTPPTSEQDG